MFFRPLYFIAYISEYYLNSIKCRLQTIVFRIRKQWDCCCLILICIVKTVVYTE